MKNLSKKFRVLSSKEKKSINGGIDLPIMPHCCGCIVQNQYGILEIIEVPCSSTCPNGSAPVSGLGC